MSTVLQFEKITFSLPSMADSEVVLVKHRVADRVVSGTEASGPGSNGHL